VTCLGDQLKELLKKS